MGRDAGVLSPQNPLHRNIRVYPANGMGGFVSGVRFSSTGGGLETAVQTSLYFYDCRIVCEVTLGGWFVIKVTGRWDAPISPFVGLGILSPVLQRNVLQGDSR